MIFTYKDKTFSEVENLSVAEIVDFMERQEQVPTPIGNPIYDGWLRLVVVALRSDPSLVTRVHKLEERWLKEHRAKAKEAQRLRKLRTPKWLSKEEKAKIREFYKNRPEGYHVDHIIPLRGKNVSGLHVLSNLQYLPARMNLKKYNKYV